MPPDKPPEAQPRRRPAQSRRPIRQEAGDGASSVTDRLQFGLIAAAMGAVLGAFASVVVLGIFALAGVPHSFNRWMVGFSAAFFCFVGVVRGADSADTLAESFGAALVAALAALGIAGGGAAVVDGSPQWRTTLWWTIFYFSGMVLLAWFA